jgi:hypothetical protein
MGLSQTKQMTQNEVDQLNLGKVMDRFPVLHQSFNRWLLVILGIILLVDGSLSALINTFDLWNAIRSHGRAVLLVRITEPMIAVFLILPIGILLIILAALNWQNGLTLYENGLVIKQRNREIVWLWDGVERFDTQITLIKFSGSTLNARRKIIIEDQQQNTLRFGNRYERMDELVTQLREHILPGLFNRKRRELNNAGEIPFHADVTALSKGLQIKGGLFPWHELQITADKKGNVRILHLTDQQDLLISKTNQFRNFDVLMHLAENPPIPTS